MPFTELQNTLNERASQGLQRQRHTRHSPQSPHIVIEGTAYLAFCSNDYLGLANHPQLINALQQGAQQYGAGAGAAHLVSGHSVAHHQLEQAIASFVNKPAALLFSTGYMANLGAVQALVGKGDTVFADKLNHASLNDAMLLSRAAIKRYRHNDMAHLAALLEQTGEFQGKVGRKLIITDAVFSMDGDQAPLPELLALCEQYDAWLLLDDAHGFGVLGEQGRGSLFKSPPAPLLQRGGVAGACVDNPPLSKGGRGDFCRIIYMATLGKAAGVFGAFVAAEQVVIDTLINQARSYVYTTAMPPALACAVLESLKLIGQGDALREHLRKLIAQLRNGLADLPWKLMSSNTAIQPLLVGDNQTALALSKGLRERGIWLTAIRPPTVPVGTARLRITLSAAHSFNDVEHLIEALHELAH